MGSCRGDTDVSSEGLNSVKPIPPVDGGVCSGREGYDTYRTRDVTSTWETLPRRESQRKEPVEASVV